MLRANHPLRSSDRQGETRKLFVLDQLTFVRGPDSVCCSAIGCGQSWKLKVRQKHPMSLATLYGRAKVCIAL